MEYKVEVLNTKRTVKTVKKNDMKPFITNENQLNGRDRVSLITYYEYLGT